MARVAMMRAVEAELGATWRGMVVYGHLVSVDARPSGDAAFLRVQYPVANAEQVSIGAPGANRWREDGAFAVAVFRRKHEKAQAWDDAEAIADLFRGRTIGELKLWGPSAAALDDEIDRGAFYAVSVVVPYWFDYYG